MPDVTEPGATERNGDGLLERSRRVREDASRLGRSLGELLEGGEGRLCRELERRPYRALSIAAGAGYVLGGGLPTWVVRSAVGLGGRLFLASILRDLLAPETQRRNA